ncbi:hypothetical protein [Mangrovimonas cancribranchiae]|uniref:Uncharacterized protein n=1 Tax=Mangrovimonas cancribranchiae TaxID=3080055 RepID=A0AAU6NZD6_9FLAO
MNNLDIAKNVKPSYKGSLSHDLNMSSKEVALYINPIIAENRNISLEEAKKKSKLRPVEVVLFYNKIGEPLRDCTLV